MKQLQTSILAAALIFFAGAPPAHAQADKIKRDVNRLGVDEKVELMLLDRTRLKGRITEIGEDYFVFIDKRTADSRTLTFAQVRQIKRVGDNPFGDPGVLMGLALVPLVIGLCVAASSR